MIGLSFLLAEELTGKHSRETKSTIAIILVSTKRKVSALTVSIQPFFINCNRHFRTTFFRIKVWP